MGAPLGRRQPRAAADVGRANLAHRHRLAPLGVPSRPARGRSRRGAAVSTSIAKPNGSWPRGVEPHQARLQARRIVWRRRSGERGEPRRPRHDVRRSPGPRHAARRAAVAARLALHPGGRAHPRARHRRQRRDLQRDQRRALPAAVHRRSRHARGHLSERSRWCPDGQLVCGVSRHGGVHRHLRRQRRHLHSPSGHLLRRRSSPAGDRGEHVGLVPHGARTATRARTVVHRGGGRH